MTEVTLNTTDNGFDLGFGPSKGTGEAGDKAKEEKEEKKVTSVGVIAGAAALGLGAGLLGRSQISKGQDKKIQQGFGGGAMLLGILLIAISHGWDRIKGMGKKPDGDMV